MAVFRISIRPQVILTAAFVVLAFSGCADRQSIAAQATVETFYGAIQNDNLPLVEDNLAKAATPQFRERVEAAAQAAQSGGDAQRSVQLVRVDEPSMTAGGARIQVRFADGQTDIVSLVREGLRWKVLTSGRLG